jgi:hypothetical protein
MRKGKVFGEEERIKILTWHHSHGCNVKKTAQYFGYTYSQIYHLRDKVPNGSPEAEYYSLMVKTKLKYDDILIDKLLKEREEVHRRYQKRIML